jgi:hypothetical protein
MKKLKEIAKFSTNYLSYQIFATVFSKDSGLIIDISGPNDHLGGIGIGIPYVRRNGEKSANSHCISFPSHRDGELAATLARMVAKISRRHTIMIIGIHIPEITRVQINEITQLLENWVANWAQQLINEISLSSDRVDP